MLEHSTTFPYPDISIFFRRGSTVSVETQKNSLKLLFLGILTSVLVHRVLQKCNCVETLFSPITSTIFYVVPVRQSFVASSVDYIVVDHRSLDFNFTKILRPFVNSQVSAKPSPADEQQQISADSAGRLRRDPVVRKNKINPISIEAHRRARRFLI